MAKKLRQRPARVPLAQVFIERNGRGGGNIADRQAIKVVDHQAQQFASAAEHQVAARRVELPEQPAQQAAIQFDVVRRVQINLEIAFAVIARIRADQHGVLKFIRIEWNVVNLAAKLARFRRRDREHHHARILLVKRQGMDRHLRRVPEGAGEFFPVRAGRVANCHHFLNAVFAFARPGLPRQSGAIVVSGEMQHFLIRRFCRIIFAVG